MTAAGAVGLAVAVAAAGAVAFAMAVTAAGAVAFSMAMPAAGTVMFAVVVMVAVRGRVERKISVRESARRFVGVSRYARVYRYPRFRERGKRPAAYSSAYQRFRAALREESRKRAVTRAVRGHCLHGSYFISVYVIYPEGFGVPEMSEYIAVIVSHR